MKSIAIMQPTFMPWIGYLALMDAVDEFVYLDHVQFDKRSWQQRNRIKTANGPLWLSVPVASRGKRAQAINEAMIIREDAEFPRKIIKSIEHNYKKAPFYEDYAPELFAILSGGHAPLCELNTALIDFFRRKIGIDTPLSFSSAMNVQGRKAALLVDICRQKGAKRYVSPPGSREYLDTSDDFDRAGIPVAYFEYAHPEWRQLHGEFEPYMSALDLLMNMGGQSIGILRQGARVA
jgi:hypothetical protein